MTSSDEHPHETPSPLTQVTCDRCGVFADQVSTFGRHRWCASCLGRLATGKRFWSSTYLTFAGGLLNPTISTVLLAISFRRIGAIELARNWAIGAAVICVVFSALLIGDVPIPPVLVYAMSVAVAITAGHTWKPYWDVLKRYQPGQANRLLPILCLVGAVVALVVVRVLIFGEESLDE